MSDQNITELPIKTNSGVASTDYMLGIDSAEGYQILVRDVAKYIVENYNGSSIIGSAQTVKSAFDALNSKKYELGSTPGNFLNNNDDLNQFYTPGTFACKTNVTASSLSNCPTTSAFKLIVEFATGNGVPCQTIIEYNTGTRYYRYTIKADGIGWNAWTKQPTRAEVDELNSNIDITVTPTSNDNYTLSVEGEHCKRGLCVTLNIAIAQSAQSSSYIKIASIPSVYAPKGWIYMTVGISNAMVGLSPTGEIFARGNFSRREYINLTYASK